MAKSALLRDDPSAARYPSDHPHRLWVFGQSYDFYVVTSSVALSAGNYWAASRNQKTQIVLHNTAGNGSAEDTISGWNGPPPKQNSANYVVERKLTPQANRPANTADQPDTGLADAVRVVDEDQFSYHAGNPQSNPAIPNIGLSATSIGIEISNFGEELWHISDRTEPSGIEGRHVPVSTCPHKTQTYDSNHTWVCNHGRARDLNRWLHLATAFEGTSDVQAFDDEQYMTLTLLLRHLCIRHRIPRQFFGRSYGDVFKHWFYTQGISQAEQRLNISTVQNFRGILAHRNVHPSKICPGVVDRSRLFRGISDEWWLPVQPDGIPRPYYSGPFKIPDFVDGTPTKNSYFRYTAKGKIEGVVFRDADVNALIDTKSYYKTTDTDAYFAMVETHLGGAFPMGTNRVWHGGVHFGVQDSNPCVFAAAGGTVVAARLSSHEATDKRTGFGSQRFVLLKHAIFRETQPDPKGLEPHINYDVQPKLIFSLYMHLDAVKIEAEDDTNPPWFNIWRRGNPNVDIGMDGDKGKVFAPNIQVLLGDILGTAGYFRGRRMIHFEILSHKDTELTGSPWSDANQRAVDQNQDLICDVPALQTFLSNHFHQALEQINPVDAAKLLRQSKTLHKSEWSLTSEDQIATLIPHPDRRKILWPFIKRFSWVADAIAANTRLGQELGDANGMFWHYHPITFMQDMNVLATTENRTPEDTADYTKTNVEVDGKYYLTNFVNYSHGSYVATNVDRAAIRVAEVGQAGYEYHFSRADIACMQPGNHAPQSTPPQSTYFSLFLLGILEGVRQWLGDSIKVALSYVCTGHYNTHLCVLNTDVALMTHQGGNAVDIQPANLTANDCKKLWNAVASVVDPLNRKNPEFCGMASQADLPDGFCAISYTTTPGALAALQAHPQGNVPGSEVAGFKIHIEMVSTAAAAAAAAANVNLRLTLVQLQVVNPNAFTGTCSIDAYVNGSKIANTTASDASMGQVITLDWPKQISLGPNDRLQCGVSLTAEDPANNDTVSLVFSSANRPAWGIGTSSAPSSRSSFILGYKMEWDQSDFGG